MYFFFGLISRSTPAPRVSEHRGILPRAEHLPGRGNQHRDGQAGAEAPPRNSAGQSPCEIRMPAPRSEGCCIYGNYVLFVAVVITMIILIAIVILSMTIIAVILILMVIVIIFTVIIVVIIRLIIICIITIIRTIILQVFMP